MGRARAQGHRGGCAASTRRTEPGGRRSAPPLSFGWCSRPSSSTSTSRSSVPGRSSGRTGTSGSAAGHGLVLDPGFYDAARIAALEDLQHHPELVHDEDLWVRVRRGHRAGGWVATLEGVAGMHGREGHPRMGAARELLPLRRHAADPRRRSARHGLALGLVSNGQRDLEAFARHHGLDVDVCVGSMSHGHVKPHRSIFEAALAALGATPAEAAMVGTATPTTSRAPARSGCARSCSTVTASTRPSPTGSTRSSLSRQRWACPRSRNPQKRIPAAGHRPASGGGTPLKAFGIRRRKCLVRARNDVDVAATIRLHREEHRPFVAQRRAAHLSCVS